MLSISVETNIDQITKNLTRLEKQELPFATSRALWRTGELVRDRLRDTMPRYIDRPRKSTVNSIRHWAPRKEVVFQKPARVFVNNALRDSLYPHVVGETVTELDGNTIISPVNIDLNQFGNIKGLRNTGVLQAMRENRYQDGDFFEVPLGQESDYNGLHAGIYERVTSDEAWLMVAYFRSRVVEKVWPFHEIALGSFRAHFQPELAIALRQALKSRRS